MPARRGPRPTSIAGVRSVTVSPGWTTVTLMPVRAQLVGQVLGHRGHRDVADRADERAGLPGGQPADVDDPAPALRPSCAARPPGRSAGSPAPWSRPRRAGRRRRARPASGGAAGLAGWAAALTRMSTPPSCAGHLARPSRATASSSVVSAGDGQHARRRAGASPAAAASERLAAAGDQRDVARPRRPGASATARPMPRLPPVTIARLPVELQVHDRNLLGRTRTAGPT